MSTLPQYTIATHRWHGAVRFFHWTSVLLLIVAFIMMYMHENTEDAAYTYIGLHKAVGVLFFFWVIARVITRFKLKHLAPAPANNTVMLQRLSTTIHTLLYITMFSMPFAGFMMSQYAGYPVDMFGLFNIPVFVEKNPELGGFFHDAHTGLIWTMLLVLAGGHIAAAWFHQLVKKDKTINRML